MAGADTDGKGMTLDSFRQWSKGRCPSFVRTVRALVCGASYAGRACPQLEGGSSASTMQPRWAWALSGALVPKHAVSSQQL